MLPLMLFNVLSSLVVDKATDLAQEHVEDMIEDLLPESAKFFDILIILAMSRSFLNINRSSCRII